MRRKVLFYIFIILALIQISIPLSMIVKRELTLKYGVQYKFEVQPVDPYDAFRGRYVDVNVKNDWLAVMDGSQIKDESKVYVLIENNENGFAQLKGVTSIKPNNSNFIDAVVLNTKKNNTGQLEKIQVRLPVDRYYMEEKMAPAAEKAYRDRVKDAFILVRVREGFAVIDKLYIGSETIEDYLKKNH